VRGTDADPVIGARGRREGEEAEKEAKTTANAVGTIGRQEVVARSVVSF